MNQNGKIAIINKLPDAVFFLLYYTLILAVFYTIGGFGPAYRKATNSVKN